MEWLRNIRPEEAQAMLRLAIDLHRTQDPVSRKKRLIEGICQMVGGMAGTCVVTHRDPETLKQTIVSTTEYRSAEMEGEVLSAPGTLTGQSDASNPALTCGTQLAVLNSSQDLPDSRVCATLNIFRVLSRGDFDLRQRLLIEFFHAEMIWVYQPDVLLTSSSALALSPRTRQTLQHLLSGLSEKEIASRLHLSQNTVHHYVKLIHKHFSVSSRSELLARWVKN